MFFPEYKTPWWHYFVVPVYLLAWVALLSILPEGAERYWPWVMGIYLGCILALGLLHRIRGFINERQNLIDFRSLSQEEQQAFLRRVWPSALRLEFLRLVDLDETYTTTGKEVAFPFPKAERRLHWILSAACIGVVVILSFAAILLSELPVWVRAAPAIVAAALLVPSAWLLGRLSLLESTFHVTPFHVAITGPGRRERRIRLNQPLLLLNEPAKGYFEIQGLEEKRILLLHHARIGSVHAHELISDYAGLEVLLPEDPAAT